MNLLVQDSHDLTVIMSLSLASSWICRPIGVIVPDLIVPHCNCKEHPMATCVVRHD
jgi:hypothetical protein